MVGQLSSSSAILARFVARARWEDLPAAVRHESKRALVNFFATSLAGCRDPAIEAAVAVFSEFRADAACTVIGRADRFGVLHAASLNAMSGNVFDYDDTHVPTIIHPTAPVAPALFALAQSRGLSGQELLLAFALGVEVECRIGNAVSPGHYQRGWHITSTCGVFGAAAASARALHLDEVGMLWSFGNAAAQSGGLVENLGSMAKSIGVGNAASNGLLSALLAGRGFRGPEQPLEGPRGFLRVTGEAPDIGAMTKGLGESWELMKNTYKPYPCGVVLNPIIEACLVLHDRARANLHDVETIELRGHPLLRERTDRPEPRSGREAQVSAQHAAAVCLRRGKAGLDEFSDECVADQVFEDLGGKVHFVDDLSLGVETAEVVLRFRGGETMTQRVNAARGSLVAPLSDDDLSRKLQTLAAWGGSACEPGPLIEALWAVDTADDAGAVMQLAEGLYRSESSLL